MAYGRVYIDNLHKFKIKYPKDYEMLQTVIGNKIQLRINEETLIGGSFTLEVIYNDIIIGEQNVDIMSIF